MINVKVVFALTLVLNRPQPSVYYVDNLISEVILQIRQTENQIQSAFLIWRLHIENRK